MFKNRYFSRNHRLNRQMIANLNSIAKNRQRLQQLELKMKQLKAAENAAQNQSKQQTKTNDQSQITTATKTIPQDHGDLFDQKQDYQLYQYSSYEAYDNQISCISKQNKSPKQVAHIKGNPQKRIDQLKKSEQIITMVLQKQKDFISNINDKRINRKVKNYFLYKFILQKIRQEVKQPEILQVSKQILLQILQEFEKPTNKQYYFYNESHYNKQVKTDENKILEKLDIFQID